MLVKLTESKRNEYLLLAECVKCLSNYLKSKAQTNHEILLGSPTSEEKQESHGLNLANVF